MSKDFRFKGKSALVIGIIKGRNYLVLLDAKYYARLCRDELMEQEVGM